MLTSRESPFRYGCIVQDRFFCPRPLLERELTRFIRSGQNVVIQGERRMGKSSLVYETVSKMRGFRLLYVDLLNVGSVDGFCRRVLSAIKALDARSGLLRKALALIPRLRPVLSIDPASGETSFSLDAAAAADPYAVEDVVEMLASAARRNRLVIVFDEFQDMLDVPEHKTVLSLLRGKIQFQADVPYVFLGSVRNKMMDIFDDPDSPFYKSALTLCVGEIPREDFRTFISLRFKDGGRTASSEMLDRILDAANDVPGDVQELCEAIWEVSFGRRAVQEADLGEALKLIYMREGEKFESWCERLSPFQFKMLVAIARMGGQSTQSGDFLAKAGIANAATARKSLLRLQELHYVYFFRGEYRFSSTFFREWLLSRSY